MTHPVRLTFLPASFARADLLSNAHFTRCISPASSVSARPFLFLPRPPTPAARRHRHACTPLGVGSASHSSASASRPILASVPRALLPVVYRHLSSVHSSAAARTGEMKREHYRLPHAAYVSDASDADGASSLHDPTLRLSLILSCHIHVPVPAPLAPPRYIAALLVTLTYVTDRYIAEPLSTPPCRAPHAARAEAPATPWPAVRVRLALLQVGAVHFHLRPVLPACVRASTCLATY
ncbi:hypothetical protein FB451DRAFT_1401208 [Mycena latifolia]|nr:hypothetical protein FB451DRAFT_1401208 [Mycena latifolia]